MNGNDLIPRCVVKDCDRTDIAGGGCCNKHYSRMVRHGDVTTVRPSGRAAVPIPEETVVEIVRAMRRFESPTSIARRLDVGVNQIRRVMKEQ